MGYGYTGWYPDAWEGMGPQYQMTSVEGTSPLYPQPVNTSGYVAPRQEFVTQNGEGANLNATMPQSQGWTTADTLGAMYLASQYAGRLAQINSNKGFLDAASKGVHDDPLLRARMWENADRMQRLSGEVLASRPRDVDLRAGAQAATQRMTARGLGPVMAAASANSVNQQQQDAHRRMRTELGARYLEGSQNMQAALAERTAQQRAAMLQLMAAKRAQAMAREGMLFSLPFTVLGGVAGGMAGNPMAGAMAGNAFGNLGYGLMHS